MNPSVLTEEAQTKLKEVAYGILHNEHDAEDALQEVMLQLYSNHEADFLSEVQIPYLVTCVRNRAINMLRDMKNRREVYPEIIPQKYTSDILLDQSSTGYNSTPEKELVQKQKLDDGLLALSDLPEAVREVFIMKEAVGYTSKEISEHLGVPVDTVKDRLKKARRSMKESAEKSNG